MKIFVAQIKSVSGNISGNFARIQAAYKQALDAKCDICLLPELVTSGYLAEDLFLSPDFIAEIARINDKLVLGTKECALILPTVLSENNALYNASLVAQNGSIIGQTHKAILPNYGVFDEKRYFTPGKSQVIVINGHKIGIPICEDIWYPQICADLKAQGAEVFLVPNASPYEIGKFDLRLAQVASRYNETKIPFVFCNQAHAQDGIIFDGNSFCYDGELSMICEGFREDIGVVSWGGTALSSSGLTGGSILPSCVAMDPRLRGDDTMVSRNDTNHLHTIYQAIVFGLKSYIKDNGFNQVILGISGGIDSALVSALCCEALGPANVTGYMMPTSITSQESKNDAKELAELLNIELHTIPIDGILQQYIDAMNASKSAQEQDLMYQNLQARIRGTLLMAQSNLTGSLLITTGNKSEYATGYATIYGDMNGAFNPIKDLYKTQIFALARYRNNISQVIPLNIITKAPSAELASNQKDSDSLPEYETLDQILYHYIECNLPKLELYKKFEPAVVDKVIKLVLGSEFKRKQSAPGVKISTRNFEKDRRFPITNLFV